MNVLFIPTLKLLRSRTVDCLDKFNDYTQTLSSLLRIESTKYAVVPRLGQILENMMKKDDMKGCNLFGLIIDTVMNITDNMATNMPVFANQGINRKRKNQIVTPRLFDHELTEQVKAVTNKLKNLQIEHEEIISLMIKEQKKSLNGKTKLYQELVAKEENNRNEMTELSRSLQQNVTEKLEERLLEGIRTLRHIIFDFLPEGKCDELLSKVNNINTKRFVERLYKESSKKYKFPMVSEYFQYNDFRTKLLPNCTVEPPPKNPSLHVEIAHTTRGDILMTNMKIKTEGQLTDGKRLMGFLEANEGMTIKQKVELKEHKLAFGYTRPNRFCEKRWGFFRPPTPNY